MPPLPSTSANSVPGEGCHLVSMTSDLGILDEMLLRIFVAGQDAGTTYVVLCAEVGRVEADREGVG